MARIMDPVAATKRKSLDVEAESDGEDAPLQPVGYDSSHSSGASMSRGLIILQLKRVKKERREASQSIRTARLASQQKDPEADSDTSTMYSSEDDEESDDEDVNLDRYDDDAKMAAYERSLLQGQQYAVVSITRNMAAASVAHEVGNLSGRICQKCDVDRFHVSS